MTSYTRLQPLLKWLGNTPQIPLKRFTGARGRIWAKLEWYNPLGSVKDRAAYWMLKKAEERGELTREKVILEPTSGNTGITLAGLGRALGYRVRLLVPERVSRETKTVIEALGAELWEVEDDLCPRVGPGTDQAIAAANSLVAAHPELYFMPNQYVNEANFYAHYEGTGPEIWRDTGGKVTHVVIGIGTGGSVTGIGKFLKERNQDVKVVAVTPQRNHHIQGLRNLEESGTPELLKRRIEVVDRWIEVKDRDAFRTVRELAEREGLFVGPSSGAVAYAARQVADEEEGFVVALFADDGVKYRSLYHEMGIFDERELDFYYASARFKGLRLIEGLLDPSRRGTVLFNDLLASFLG